VVPSREPLADAVLTVAAINALEFAAARRDGEPLGTADVLLGVIEADSAGSWETVQLRTRFVDSDDARAHPDPAAGAGGAWHDVPLTGSAADGLERAVRIAGDHELGSIPPGVLALGALADPESGAARMLLEDASITHAELLRLVQDDVLDVRLEGAAPRARARGAADLLVRATEDAGADPELRELLGSMLLGPDQLIPLVAATADLPDEPAEAVVTRARQRFDTDAPGPAAILATLAARPSNRVAEVLRRLALTPGEVAAQLADFHLRAEGADRVTASVVIASLLNGLASLATTALVVLAALESAPGTLWKLLFVPVVWTGHPQLSPAASVAVSAVFAVVVSPAAGIAHLVGVIPDVIQARAERAQLLARTGVHLSLRELRRVVRRFLNARARTYQLRRQRAVAALRTLRETRTERS
jgi:hypothetical protein